jgi:uncharacterized protein with PQ loop repeat
MNEYTINIIGLIGSFLIGINLIPQIIIIIKKKSGKNISYLTLYTNIIACILMLIYGYYKKIIPVLISNALILISLMFIIILKKYYGLLNKKKNSTNIETKISISENVNLENVNLENVNSENVNSKKNDLENQNNLIIHNNRIEII